MSEMRPLRPIASNAVFVESGHHVTTAPLGTEGCTDHRRCARRWHAFKWDHRSRRSAF